MASAVTKKNRLEILAGKFPPSTQIRSFNDSEWEEFIEECCVLDQTIRGPYVQVKRLGSSGDGGRDIEARLVEKLEPQKWDLYQAKHYKDPISPSVFFPEIAKFFWQLSLGTYPKPRFYFICAPCNTGSDLHNLLVNPVNFKSRFLEDWENGKTGLKSKASWRTVGALQAADDFDFGNIKEILSRDLLLLHASDQAMHYKRFKITPVRGDDPPAPTAPSSIEAIYLKELVKVYEENCGKKLSVSDALEIEEYAAHLIASRGDFYCAEGLKRFSRDIFPEEFNKLLDMVHQGIRSNLANPIHKSGLDRLTSVTTNVSSININDSKLHDSLRPGDLPGSCHHLVNDGVIKWIK